MGYSKFKKIKQLKEKFGLSFTSVDLFADKNIAPIASSEWLNISIKRAYRTPPTNEKSKSERIVSPILLEVLEQFNTEISFYSGEEININAKDNLAGPCDFFFTLGAPTILFECPIVSLVEAKDEDLEWGIAQCAAQIYAAHLYNKNEGKEISVLYGCATTGDDWQFIRFENNIFYIDSRPTTNLQMVLGTFHKIFDFYTQTPRYVIA